MKKTKLKKGAPAKGTRGRTQVEAIEHAVKIDGIVDAPTLQATAESIYGGPIEINLVYKIRKQLKQKPRTHKMIPIQAVGRGPLIQVKQELCGFACGSYLIYANKTIKYKLGSSRIIYVGKSTRGGVRAFDSLEERFEKMFSVHGITEISVDAFNTSGISESALLEAGFICGFHELHREGPKFNKQLPKKPPWAQVSRDKILGTLQKYG